MTLDPNLERRPVEHVEVERVRRDVIDQPVVPPAATEREEYIEEGGGFARRESVVRDAAGDVHREAVVQDAAASQWLWLSKLSQVVWLIIGIVEILIGLRVILRLIAANPANSFAAFIYNASAPFLAPFFGLTGTPSAGGSVLEVPSLIAMAVYLLIGWLIVQVIWLLERPLTHGAVRYDRYRF